MPGTCWLNAFFFNLHEIECNEVLELANHAFPEFFSNHYYSLPCTVFKEPAKRNCLF